MLVKRLNDKVVREVLKTGSPQVIKIRTYWERDTDAAVQEMITPTAPGTDGI